MLQIIAIAIFIIDRFFTQFEEKQYFWSLRKFNFLLTISNSIFNYLILFSTILSTDTICCFISLVVCSLYLVSLAIVVVDIVIVGVASVVVVALPTLHICPWAVVGLITLASVYQGWNPEGNL